MLESSKTSGVGVDAMSDDVVLAMSLSADNNCCQNSNRMVLSWSGREQLQGGIVSQVYLVEGRKQVGLRRSDMKSEGGLEAHLCSSCEATCVRYLWYRTVETATKCD